METWQFSLFFAALLVGYVLIHLRIVRFEEHLRGLAVLRSIDERIAALPAQLPTGDKERLARIELHLQSLRDAIEDLRETSERVGESLGEAIVRIPQPAAPVVVEGTNVAPQPTMADRIRALVEARLLQMGFGNLRMLTELTDRPLDGDVEVQVECERRHMPYKGRVLVRNGAVRDVAMQSAATSFP